MSRATVFVAFATVAVVWLSLGFSQQRAPGFGVVTVAPKGGWYTEAQAARGEEAYTRHCAACHGIELGGVIGVTPALAGPSFRGRWAGQPLDRLFHYARALMPLDDPGALADGTYADILAYVVQQNGYPAGTHELRPDRHQLGRTILPEKPPATEAQEEGAEGSAD